MALITVSNLKKKFNLEAGFFARFGRFVRAVNGIDFFIDRNESYGLVGESGCGKTTAARLLVRMYEADEGSITYDPGEGFSGGRAGPVDVRSLKRGDLKNYREKVKYVFQDPARSLNPRMTVYEVLNSGRRWSSLRLNEKQSREEAAALLEEVGLSGADLERRPSEFSGGQRQRISIARALLMKPDLLICDEVISALDVSIQGQILNLLLDLRAARKLSFLFIAHDLKIASYFCDRIGVMYRGELMEEAPAETLWKNGVHPYTALLFSSVTASAFPVSGISNFKDEDTGPENITGEKGAKFEEKNPPAGTAEKEEYCAFSGRCPYAEERCFKEKPAFREIQSGRGKEEGKNALHLVRCFKVK